MSRDVSIRLRPVTLDDLPGIYEMQRDPESCDMAGVKPRSESAFYEHWHGVMGNPAVFPRVIELDGAMAGLISVFQADGEDALGYWIERSHWGRGIATQAVRMLLEEVPVRPLKASAASDNIASRKILERCGFTLTGIAPEPETDRYMARDTAHFILQ